jgi:hypothetical protein
MAPLGRTLGMGPPLHRVGTTGGMLLMTGQPRGARRRGGFKGGC